MPNRRSPSWRCAPRKGSGVAFPQPRVEGRSTSTLGLDIKRDSNSVGVAISRRRYPNANPSPPICRGIIQLSITPTAKRNSYRVAILVGALPRVAGHARNPGLCNRNSYRVAKGAYHPQWTTCVAGINLTTGHLVYAHDKWRRSHPQPDFKA